jgi:hypothetical protein
MAHTFSGAIDAVSKYADAETERANAAERKVAAGLALADECDRRLERETDRVLKFWNKRLRAALTGADQ